MMKDPAKVKRKEEAKHYKTLNLAEIRLAIAKDEISFERAMMLMLMVQSDPSADGQKAINSLILKARVDSKRGV